MLPCTVGDNFVFGISELLEEEHTCPAPGTMVEECCASKRARTSLHDPPSPGPSHLQNYDRRGGAAHCETGAANQDEPLFSEAATLSQPLKVKDV